MNWGVAFLFLLSESSSTILPTANHNAALRRCLSVSDAFECGCKSVFTYLTDVFLRLVFHDD